MKSPSRGTRNIATRRVRAASARHERDAMLAWAGFALTALLAAMMLPMIPSAHAATAIQRCIADDGTPVYTDKPCSLLNAQRSPISGELLGRIARDQAASSSTAGDFRSSPRTALAVARRSAASGCARTPTQLTMDLQGAWALGDVNRLAESYHWVGLNHRQGQNMMRTLDHLASQTLLQADYYDARIGGGDLQLSDAAGSGSSAAGILQVTVGEGDARSVQDFDVQRYRGCYFIRFF